MTSGSLQTSAYTWTSSDGVKRSLYHVVTWELVETDIGRNVSKIRIVVKSAGGSTWSVNEKKAEVLIDDVRAWYRSGTESRKSGATILDDVFEVEHTNDGTKTFKLTFAVCLGGGTSQNRTKSAEFELDTIPRQANITAAPDFNDLGTPSVEYVNPAGDAVTELQVGIGTAENTADLIAFRDMEKTGTKCTIGLSEAERNVLRDATPGTSRKMFLCVKTVLGGVTFYSNMEVLFSIIESDATKPTASTTLNGVGLFKDMYLQGRSSVKVDTTAAGKNGATISTISTTVGQGTYTGSSITSDVLMTPGTVAITTTVTDSRGFTCTVEDSIEVMDYYRPVLKAYGGNANVLLYRADAIGSAKDDSSKLRLMVTVEYADVPENTPTLKYRYRQSNASAYGPYATLPLSDGSYNDSLPEDFPAINSYVVEIAVFDTVGESSEIPFDVPTARRDFQLKRGGGGASFGKAAEVEGVLDVAWSIHARSGFYASVVPAGENFNDYTHAGEYIVPSKSRAEGMQNIPAAAAGRLIVFSPNSNYADLDGPSRCMIQVYITVGAAIYIRSVSSSEESVKSYGTWRSI